MTQEHVPRPVKAAPEWIGDGESHRDVSGMSDRAIAVMSLDAVLRLMGAVRRHVGELLEFRKEYQDDKLILLRELPDHERRIAALELGPIREEIPSSHEWNKMLEAAGVVLSQRVKDPKDQLNSDRARQIAKDVIEGAKTADDARSFRALKSRGGSLALEALKWIAAAGAGYLAARYGVHV